MIDSLDEVCDILGAVYLMEPRSLEELGSPVCEVCTEHAVDDTVVISLIELFKSVCEDSISSVSEYSLSLLLLELISNIEHGLTRRDDIVRYEYVLILNRISEVFMSNDRIASVYDSRVVTSLIEHTHFNAEHRSIVHISVESAFVGAYYHELVLLEAEVFKVTEHSL